ncbi:MAG: LL-diaminopimelate aminotransferase [Spirochaetales bacterium]|nr:LL-diaminopimelate aminotransferase [Spirochaetales bacterium]MCF7937933.1 LL-diaminopimelate aminotransferase [Spirochaetales bacterium]
MIRINEHYKKLQSSYLFSSIAKQVSAFQEANPDTPIIKLGIGDVTRALPPAILEAFHAGVDEMGRDESFRGYGPEQGYAFLREAIAEGDFAARGARVDPEEIFVSDGSKCDTGNIQEIFAEDIRVAVPDPVYPVYVDTNVMAGRTGGFTDGRYRGLTYLDATERNGFVPRPAQLEADSESPDLIYLCFPNNPTGATATKEQLNEWVNYARKNKSIIIFDAAYFSFIRDESIPQSIYEIPGAREVAIEMRSFSKTAGFTGTRCAFTVIPSELVAWDKSGGEQRVHALWNRRHSTKFNGVSYPVQRAAAAVYTQAGRNQIRELTDYYLQNASIIRKVMTDLGYSVTGGEHSPYIWIKTGSDSWSFFDRLLNEAGVVITPGMGFGSNGEGFIRISAFNHSEKVEEAMDRIRKALS